MSDDDDEFVCMVVVVVDVVECEGAGPVAPTDGTVSGRSANWRWVAALRAVCGVVVGQNHPPRMGSTK